MKQRHDDDDNDAYPIDLGDDLVLDPPDRDRRQMGGTWVCGTIHGHAFQALVFPAHASNPDHEIDDSRISKLWLQRLADRRVVYNWDRGLDRPPVDRTATAIVDFLAAGLAESTYSA